LTRTVFVTGGAGYVGAHCCKAFAQAGWKVVVYDNLSRGWRSFVQWGELIEGDVRDRDQLLTAMSQTKPDAVAHFAGLAYVGESMSDPGSYFDVNTVGGFNTLEAMKIVGIPTMVFSSTCATYGTPKQQPITEHMPQSPINPYGWSKLFVEQMAADYGRAHGIRSVALRYFNAAGADPDGDVGERHELETHVIPLAIRGASAGDYEFTIFGNDFDTPDGTCVRDYIHVSDLADAHVRALAYLDEGGATDVVNLGVGRGISILELLDAIEHLARAPVRCKIGPRREGDPAALIASAEKARLLLGWRATRSDIHTILQDAWRWHAQENLAA
jgi:UDP-arabinose 4-epimerase